MRKAILDENKKVVGFEPVQEELSKEAQEQRQNQIDFVAKKYGFRVDKQLTLWYTNNVRSRKARVS